MQPVIKQLADGRYACEYKNADGSVTNFTGATYEELINKLATAHSSVTDALSRSRKQSVEHLRQAQDAVSAANTEKIILSWLRSVSTEFGGNFYVCGANNDILLGWLRDKQLPATSDNLNMALQDLTEHNALASAPSQQREPVEEPLPTTPPGYPELNTVADVRALGQQLRPLLDQTKHRADVITAFKARIDEILRRSK